MLYIMNVRKYIFVTALNQIKFQDVRKKQES